MVTKEEEKKLLDELYKKERPEFKQWVCKQLGAVREDRKPGHKYPDGYISELNTCVMVQQSLSVGMKVYEKASFFLSGKEKYNHIIIIAFSFNGKIRKLVHEDPTRKIMLATVENLMNEIYVSNLHRVIRDIDDPSKLSRIFKGMKK